MGKGGQAKQRVVEYRLAVHFGIAHAVDAITGIFVDEKLAWSGYQAEEGDIGISAPELFGGVKKEGGVEGRARFLPGGAGQVMPEGLAARMGRTSENCPAYRHLSSLFFTGFAQPALFEGGGVFSEFIAESLGVNRFSRESSGGFYWTANSPYIKPVAVKAIRAPKGLDPSIALIPNSSAANRTALYFILDRSGSMAENSRLVSAKAALGTVLDRLAGAVGAGANLDIGVGAFSTSATNIVRNNVDGSDITAIRNFINALTASGVTQFDAPMEDAVDFFTDSLADSTITKRVLIFMTDGEPTDSSHLAAADILADLLNPSTEPFSIASGTAVDVHGINIDLENTTFTAFIDNTPLDGVPVVAGGNPASLLAAIESALSVPGATANPAHIIYEALTDTEWGMGGAPGTIDIDSFTAAANTLYGERFGLAMILVDQTEVEEFVNEVQAHIQSTLFIHPRTGKWTLKLIRGDYDIDDLPVLDESNARIIDFRRKSFGETIGEIVVTWTNPENEEEETVTVQDLAICAVQGAPVSTGRNHYGIRNAELARTVGERDLRAASAPLAAFEIEVDRTGWDLVPGGVVKVNFPSRGIDGLVLRIGKVDYGTPKDGRIRLKAVEDVFALPVAAYQSLPPATSHVSLSENPRALDFAQILTTPLYFAQVMSAAAELAPAVFPEVASFVLAAQGGTDTTNYDIIESVILPGGGAELENLGTYAILGSATLAAALPAEAISVAPAFVTRIGVAPRTSQFVFLGTGGDAGVEIALITAIDSTTGEITLRRGVLDTVPAAWATGTRLWCVGNDQRVIEATLRSAGETVEYKLLPRTSRGQLPLPLAVTTSATLTARPYLPNRPADVKVNGEGFNTVTGGIPDPINVVGINPVPVTWSTRNRLFEPTTVLTWTDAPVTPEDDQTTVVTIHKLDGTLVTTHDALLGNSFDVPLASFGEETTAIVRVASENTAGQSLQAHELIVQVGGGRLLLSDIDELVTGFKLLSGDASDGDDQLAFSGDAA